MTYDFIYKQQILNKTFDIREISFIEYRNLVKNILSDDVKVVENAFEQFLKCVLFKKENLTVQEKFLILLKYRELIHGKQVEFFANDAKINYSIDNIFDFLHKKLPFVEHEQDGIIFSFGLPTKIVPDNDKILYIANCLRKINGEEVFINDISSLPALPINQIYKQIIDLYEPLKFKIQYIDYDVSLIDISFLYFLKSIFAYDLQGLYDIEYSLRVNLNFSINDLQKLSFPECNVMLRLYNKDVAEREKAANPVDSNN